MIAERIGARLRAKEFPFSTQIADFEHHLRQSSQPGQRVAIAPPNSLAFVAALLATMKLGRVPFLGNDPEKAENRGSHVQPPAALILETSGSSGQKKRVHLPESALLATYDHMIERFRLDARSVTMVMMPLTHTFALNTQFFPIFLAGGQIHFLDSRLQYSHALRSLMATETTFFACVGRALIHLRDEMQRYGLKPATTVQDVQCAGDLLTSQQLAAAHEVFPNARIHVGYGSTEALRVTMAEVKADSFETGFCGEPLPGCEIEIRKGEIFVRSPFLMSGYEGDESAIGSDGFFATGDLGTFSRSGLYFKGRKDNRFKCNGEFIQPAEVEKQVRARMQANSVICIPLPDESNGVVPAVFVDITIASEDEMIQRFFDNRFPRPIHFFVGPLGFLKPSRQELALKAKQILSRGRPLASQFGQSIWLVNNMFC